MNDSHVYFLTHIITHVMNEQVSLKTKLQTFMCSCIYSSKAAKLLYEGPTGVNYQLSSFAFIN